MLRWTAIGLALALPLAGALAVACTGGGGDGAAEPGPSVDLTREAEADGVTVEGTWLTAESLSSVDADLSAYPLDEFVLVEIDFTTHSGNLNDMDMEQASGLERGDEAEAPVAWVSLSDDSHHRSGLLIFPRQGRGGPSEVTIDLGGESVSLVWQSVPDA